MLTQTLFLIIMFMVRIRSSLALSSDRKAGFVLSKQSAVRGKRSYNGQLSVRSSRRSLQADKHKDKQKNKNKRKDNKQKDKTDKDNILSTANPTISPTPIGSPTQHPTPNPSTYLTATTIAPTHMPTLKPSMQPAVTVSERFFLHFSLTRERAFSGADIMEGKEKEFAEHVINAIFAILCTSAHLSVAFPERSAHEFCKPVQSLQDQSVIFSEPVLVAEDRRSNDLHWIEWTVGFLIMQVGEEYYQMALAQLNGKDTEKEARELAGKLMANNARDALDHSIREGRFDELLVGRVQASVIGEEEDTFGNGRSQTMALKIAPFHRLRVAGIALFIVTVVGYLALLHSAKRHKRSGENRKIHQSGLNSQEGLDQLLEPWQPDDVDDNSTGKSCYLPSYCSPYSTQASTTITHQPETASERLVLC